MRLLTRLIGYALRWQPLLSGAGQYLGKSPEKHYHEHGPNTNDRHKRVVD